MGKEDIDYKVRVQVGSWWSENREDCVVNGVLFSSKIALDHADGLFGIYDPPSELLDFNGPKLWYHYEPSWHSHYHRHPIGKVIVHKQSLMNRAWYNHPDISMRVPHITTANDFSMVRNQEVKSKAVACVSNFGGRYWYLKRHIWLRNKMILSPLVELFGAEHNWKLYPHFPKIWKQGTPINYHGRAPGTHTNNLFLKFLASYKVCVCLENSCEAMYFSEKFVNAVRSGCIPIYHAHPTVRNGFLKGAAWVDPADFNFNADKTIEYALACNPSEYRHKNDKWLESGVLSDTTPEAFWKLISQIMRKKIEA